MRLFLCPNGFTAAQAEQAAQCLATLEAGGRNTCALSLEDSRRLFGTEARAAFPPAGSDLIVSLGGDGALLRAAQVAIEHDKPLIGINGGRLGFLCALALEDAPRFNEIIPACRLSERTALELEYDGRTYRAVNDVVIAKRRFGATVELGVTASGLPPFSLRGDGLIVATPTGSTAYALSAGGAVIEPSLPVWELVPVCPHEAAYARLIADDTRVTVTPRHDEAEILADGQSVGPLKGPLTIYRSLKRLHLYGRRDGTMAKDR